VSDPSVQGSEPPTGVGDSDDPDDLGASAGGEDFAADIAAMIGEDVVVPAPAAHAGDEIDGADLDPTDGNERAGYSSCEEALEDAVTSLERVTAERDEYLDTARRVQAEFENYRKRVDSQRTEQIARAAEALVVELLPVLDACDAAVSHGAADVEPILASLSGTLAKQGLVKADLVEVPFDPNQHEAVLSEPGDGDDDGPVVAEVLRAGYQWNGRVLRPAMVKVRG
jgi:molecular chaperone GrpE